MTRYNVKLQTRVWHKDMTPQLLFARMPYMLDTFNFIGDSHPDFVMFSDEFTENLPNNCDRIYFPGEHRIPDWNGYEWAVTFCYDNELKDPRHLRLANYTRLGAGIDLIKTNVDPKKILRQKTQFCAYVYWHHVPIRIYFFDQLSQYKFIHAPGESKHNTQYIPGSENQDNLYLLKNMYSKYDQKVDYLKKFKFTIAFANEESNCYTSEKIYHAMLANSIPIYWGNTQVHKDFNTKSFLNYYDYGSWKALIEKIIELDKNDDLYTKYLEQPWYPDNRVTSATDPSVILSYFKRVFRCA